jgi:hypothetical protein
MKDCEHYETLISAWQDGELDRPGQVEMLDHLVRCAGCRDFYLGARGLTGLVAAVGGAEVGERPSPEVWRRIQRAAGSRESSSKRGAKPWWRLPAPVWAGAAAALVALLVILAIPRGGRPAAADIRLGGNPGGMDDLRFVEVTRMVLGADRRYRTAFYEIMKQVVRDTEENQPSRDILPPRGEVREGVEIPDSRHGPS